MKDVQLQEELVLSALTGNIAGIDRALAAGALIDIDDLEDAEDPGWGYTPLQAAAYGYKPAAFDHLLARGADIHAVGTKPDPVAWLAIQERHNRDAQILERAIEAGADLSWRGSGGITLLHVAALVDHADAARVLLGHGFDPEVRTDEGHTPLHQAAIFGSARCTLALAQAGADIEAVASAGYRPIDLAIARRPNPTVAMLVALGVRTQAMKCRDPDTQAILERSPLECTFTTGEPQALLWCLEHGAQTRSDQLRSWMSRCAQDDNTVMTDFLRGLMAQHEARAAVDDLAHVGEPGGRRCGQGMP